MKTNKNDKRRGNNVSSRARIARAALEVLECRLLMSTATWNGADGNGEWQDPANWAFHNLPTTGDSVIFPSHSGATQQISLTSAVEVNDFSINGSYQFTDNSNGAGAAITVDGTIDSESASSVINNTVVLNSNNVTIHVGTGDDLALYETDDNGNGYGITKTGAGQLDLEGANDYYTGPTTISSGTLNVDANLDTSAVAVDTGTVLEGPGDIADIDGQGGTVSLSDLSGDPATRDSYGTITLANSTLQEVISYSQGVEYDGLLVAHSGSTVDLTNASLNVSLLGGYTPALGRQVTLIQNLTGSPVTGTFNGLPEGGQVTINGVGYQITYNGNGEHDVVLTVVHPTDVWTGAANDNQWNTAGNWQGNTVPASGDNISLPNLGSNQTITLDSNVNVGNITIAGDYTINGGSYNISTSGTITSSSTGSTINGLALTQNTPVSVASSANLTLNDISGSYSISKSGAGTLILGNTSDTNSGFTVSAGTLEEDGSLTSSVTVNSGGTLDGSGTTSGITDNGGTIELATGSGPATLSSSGAVTLNSSSTLDEVIGESGSTETDGELYAQGHFMGVSLGNATLNVTTLNGFTPAVGDVITLISNGTSEAISGTFNGLAQGAVTRINGVNYQVSYTGGSGHDVTLTVVPDVWTGAVNGNWNTAGNWQSGVVPASGDTVVLPNLGSNQTITLTGDVNVGNLTIGGNYTINSNGHNFASSGTITAAAGYSSQINGLVLNQNTTVNVGTGGALAINGISGSYGITKTGQGQLTLGGGPDTFNGSVTVSAGTLENDITLGSGATVDSGATLDGSGSVAGITSSSGTVTPGVGGAAGQLTDTGSLSLDSGSTLSFTLDGTSAGTGANHYGQISADGVSLAGATLSATLGQDYTPTPGDVLTLISNSGSLTGTFSGLAQGATATIGGHLFQISYTGGSGHNVTLTAISHSTTSITSSSPTAVFGQTVTYTVTVAPTSGPGTPTGGTVTLTDENSNVIGTGTLSNGTASINVSSLAVGSHTVTATYTNDPYFLTSSNSTSQVVNQANSTVTLGSTTPTTYGNNATLTATVAAASPGAGTPTGTVYFYANGSNTALGHATLSNGVATLVNSTLDQGDNVITASYSGDGNFLSSSSGSSVTQTVNSSPTTTSLSVASNNAFGQTITFTATVAASGGGVGTPDGQVQFYDSHGDLLGTQTLQNGQAVFQDSNLTIGSYSIRAVYEGSDSGDFSASSSVRHTVNVNQATTSVGLTSSSNPSTYNQSITFTATVGVTGAGTTNLAYPTGTVKFYNNATLLDTETLTNSGSVTFSTSSLAVSQSSYPITAVYSGDSNFTGSTSSTLNQTVNKATPSVSVSSSNQNNPVFGQSVTLTANVSSIAGTPTGSVTFYDGGTQIGTTQTLSNGSASINISSLPTGSDTITASYGGDSNFTSATSSNFTQTINKSSSATAVSSSVTPGVSGQTITFTATVTAAGQGAGTPTGTVTFYDGSTQIGQAQTLVSGTASVSTAALSTTSHTITAVYSGDVNFLTSTSPDLTQGENQDASSVSLNTGGSTSVYGLNPTLTATVTASAPGSGTPTGSVTFYDGTGVNAVSLGQATLSGGVATLSNYTLDEGSHSLYAVYSGDANFLTSTSTSTSYSVTAAGTSIAVTGATAGAYGQTLTVTGTVTLTSGSGTPPGSIEFYDNGTLIGTQPMSNGSASLSVPYTTIGSNPITATYVPTGNDFTGSSTSSSHGITLSEASTTTTISSTTPTVFGQSATLTATVAVSGNGVGTPTGTVNFYDNTNTLIGTGTLVSGVASINDSTLAVGTHGITAVYQSDGNFLTSTASSVNQVVNKSNTTTTLTSDSTFSNGDYNSVYGQTVNLTATVAASSPGAGTPTGTVTFMDGQTTLGTGTLSNGVATFSSTSLQSYLAVGNHSITAVYSDDANFNASTSAAIIQTVNESSTTTTVSTSDVSAVYGEHVTLTATVAATSPGSGTPSAGIVTFYADNNTGNPLGTGTVSNGTATLSNVTLPVGEHTITASYAGDATDFLPSTSVSTDQNVAQASTSLVLTTPTNVVFGQTATLTATLSVTSPGAGTPTGSVVFYADNELHNPIGTGTLSNGAVTISVSTLAVGTHGITAAYAGDGNFAASSASSVSQVVSESGTTTAVSTSDATAVSGEHLTLTAHVTAASPGVGTPNGGVVTFYADDNTLNPLGTATVASGIATLTGITLPVGSHFITASYAGDGADFLPSNSVSTNQTVAKASTSLVLTTPTPVVHGQNATLTATVSVTSPGTGNPTGTVDFYDNTNTLIGGGTISNGSASINISSLSVATHGITATYLGDQNFLTSSASSVNQVVNKSNTTTTLTSNSTYSNGVYNSVYGQPVTLTATVAASGQGAGSPSGTVTFMDGNTTLGLGTLINGVATFTSTSLQQYLAIGNHSITAVYGDDGNFNASTSAAITQDIAAASTTSTVTSSGTSVFGQSITLTAHVASQSPGNGTPANGTVTFYSDNVQIGDPQTLINGTASLQLSNLSVATHSITAVYSGNAQYLTSTSSPVSQTVTAAAANQLVIVDQPNATTTAGQNIGTVEVEVEDAFGNRITTDNSDVTLSTGTSLGGTTTVQANGGVAIFSNLSINLAGTYTLSAADQGLTTATTNSFQITPAAPAQLAIGLEPNTSPTTGQPVGSVTVDVEDAFGNIVTTDQSNVTVSAQSGGNPAGPVLSGTTSIAAINGVATFSDLAISSAGTYTLAAADSNLAGVQTTPITVVDRPTISIMPTVAITATQAMLSIDGTDTTPQGATGLTYTWSVASAPSGAKPVTFSKNGSNAAKHTTATFLKAGTYHLNCTITNIAGNSTTAVVSVQVNQVATSLSLSPHAQTLAEGSTTQYTGIALDQYGEAMRTAAPVSYAVLSGPGTINSSGLFTAGATAGHVVIQIKVGNLVGNLGATITATASHKHPRVSKPRVRSA